MKSFFMPVLFVFMCLIMVGCPLEPVLYLSGTEGLSFYIESENGTEMDVFKTDEKVVLHISGEVLENDEYKKSVDFSRADFMLILEKYDEVKGCYYRYENFDFSDTDGFTITADRLSYMFSILKENFHLVEKHLILQGFEEGRYYITVYSKAIVSGEPSATDMEELEKSGCYSTSFTVIE